MTKMPGIVVAIGVLAAGMLDARGVLRAAGAQRYANALTPLLDAAGGKTVGELHPGAAVQVIGQSGTATHVAVQGWSAKGANGLLVATPDRHITLLDEYAGPAKPGSSQTVDGKVYQQVTIDGWVATSALVDDVQTVWKSASDLFAQKCGSCHALPAADSLSADQWPAIMKTQKVNAALDANETALLTAYLQTNGKH